MFEGPPKSLDSPITDTQVLIALQKPDKPLGKEPKTNSAADNSTLDIISNHTAADLRQSG